MSELQSQGKQARAASMILGGCSTHAKNIGLKAIAEALTSETSTILKANERDCSLAKEAGISDGLLDRLALTESRVKEIADAVQLVVGLEDPVGVSLSEWHLPNELLVKKVRVPLGVVGMIYEARPNVTVDASVLCLKAGNAVLLRGSSSAIHSNTALVSVMQKALSNAGLPANSVQLVADTSRESVGEFLKLTRYLDVVIPRGGAGLIQRVVAESSVPVLETGAGICHVYIDKGADPAMAEAIVVNAKTQRPSVCNAIETLLVHESWCAENLPALLDRLGSLGVECRGCKKTCELLPELTPAQEMDWETEYLDLILSVRVVKDLDEAVAHINQYGTRHSESIITPQPEQAERFMRMVDAAAVYHNASTRFTDGFEYGFGAEIGISTQKLHARGPMGLAELTSYQYRNFGSGQVR